MLEREAMLLAVHRISVLTSLLVFCLSGNQLKLTEQRHWNSYAHALKSHEFNEGFELSKRFLLLVQNKA